MFPDTITASLIVFLIGVGAFTLTAMIWDIRTRRIPNKITVPFFFAGLIYQVAFNGLGAWNDMGLFGGLTAFALGFGALFVLWLVGGGGGGDVKLMGALSVWLGFRLTLLVLIGSTIAVIGITLVYVIAGVVRKGAKATREGLKPQGALSASSEARAQRRIMAFAVPVGIATWAVVLWKLPYLTF